MAILWNCNGLFLNYRYTLVFNSFSSKKENSIIDTEPFKHKTVELFRSD